MLEVPFISFIGLVLEQTINFNTDAILAFGIIIFANKLWQETKIVRFTDYLGGLNEDLLKSFKYK